MKIESKSLEARLELEGHANFFPTSPVATTKEWDLLQALQCCAHFFSRRGNSAAWRIAVADITAEVVDMQQLLHNLGRVERSVAPTTQATVQQQQQQQQLTHVTQHRTGHPGYLAVQLRLPCDQIRTGSEL